MANVKGKKKPIEVDEPFIEDDGDKKIMAFVAIGILIVGGIIAGLLLKDDEITKPKDEGEPKIITPDIKEDTIVEDVEEDEDEIETSVVKTSNSGKKDDYYDVVFYYGGYDNHKVSVKDKNRTASYIPDGYSSCKYYYDREKNYTVDFTRKVSSNMDIYMECVEIDYSVSYHLADGADNSNDESYRVGLGEISLRNANLGGKVFDGWYLDSEYNSRVSVLNQSIVKHADSNNIIHLYGQFLDEFTIKYYNNDGEFVTSRKTTNDTFTTLEENQETYCPLARHIGWSTSINSTVVKYGLGKIVNSRNITLYPVCGENSVKYVVYDGVEESEVTVTYTDEEIAPGTYETPDETKLAELGIDAPTYYVKVAEKNDISKTIINDTEEFVKEDEVKLNEVLPKAAVGYDPVVGDYVEEKKKVLEEWKEPDPVDPTDPSKDTPVDDSWTPEADKDEELHNEWVEQPTE